MRTKGLWIWLVAALIVVAGCAPEFEGDECTTNQDCFPDEVCSAEGLCVLDEGSDAGHDAHHDADQDADQDVDEDPVVESIEVSPASAEIGVGLSVTLQATAYDADGEEVEGAEIRWSTQYTTLVEVSEAGVVTGLVAGEAVVRASWAEDEGVFGTADIDVVIKEVERVEVTPESATVVVGESAQFSAAAFTEDDVEVEDTAIVWSVEDTDIAEIDADGQVTGLAEGTTTVIANIQGVEGEAELAVELVPVDRVEVLPVDPELEVGQIVELTATAFDEDDEELEDREVVWSSDDETVATVDEEGVVTAQAEGTAVITAEIDEITGSVTVTVEAASDVQEPVAVTIIGAPSELVLGEEVVLSAEVVDEDGAEIFGEEVSWSSSDETVATVSEAGVVTGVGVGSTTIMVGVVSDPSISDSVAVDVDWGEVLSIEVSPSSASVEVGETTTFSAVAYNEETADITAGVSFAWSSDDEAIATVDAGVVTGESAGDATITASADGVDGHATVTVTTEPVAVPSEIEVAPTSLSLIVGEAGSLVAVVVDQFGEDMSGVDLSWESSDEALVTVIDGEVQSHGVGDATVTVSVTADASIFADIAVEVEWGDVDTIEVSPADVTLEVGETQAFVATAYNVEGVEIGEGVDFSWSSGDSDIFTVDQDGVVTALAEGSTSVLAAVDDVTGSASVIVEEAADPEEACLIISEYVEGTGNNKAVEVYNCASTSLDMTGYGMCNEANDRDVTEGDSCTNTYLFEGTLDAGETFVLCHSSSVADIKANCDVESAVASFNGDDRIFIFQDVDGGGYQHDTDVVIDSFGEIGVEPSSRIWEDVTYRRCDFTPYLGVGDFVVDDYYAEFDTNDFDGLGQPPTEGCD